MRLKIMVPLVLVATLSATTSAFGSDTTPTNVVTIQSNFKYISSLATAPNGDIWVADWTLDQVKLISKDSSGSASPLKTISLFARGDTASARTDASSIAVDSNGFLYVADASTGVYQILVFNPALGANQTREDATRTIDLGHRARTIALDSSGQIYAAGRYNSQLEIRIFSAGTSAGSGVPIRTFTDSSTISTGEPYGLAIFPSGEVAVAQYSTADIRIFSSNASGPVNPIRIISGGNTNLADWSCLATDTSGRLYAANSGKLDIQIFAPLADGDVAPMASIRNIPGIEPDEYGWGITLEKDSQIWVGNYQSLIHFNNPFAPAAQAPTVDPVDPVAAAKAAEAARARAVESAKTEIKNALTTGRPLTVNNLIGAEIYGITSKNIDLVNLEISKLSQEGKSDIKQVERIVLKYATVDKVAEHANLYPSDLINVGLVSPESKIKSFILSEIKKLPASSLDSFEKIQVAVLAVEKKFAERRTRLEATLARTRR